VQRSFRFADPDGAADLAILNILINQSLDGRQACHIAYDIRASLLHLVDVDGIGANTAPIGVPGILSNVRCRIFTDAVRFTRDSHSVTLTVAYDFLLSVDNIFGRAIYGAARDRSGNNSGWQVIGYHSRFFVIPVSPRSVLESPANPTRPLSFIYSNFNNTAGNESTANLKFVQVLIQNSLDGRRACYLGFDQDNNLLYLMNDEGTHLLPNALRLNGIPGGVEQIENSQCRILSAGWQMLGFLSIP